MKCSCLLVTCCAAFLLGACSSTTTVYRETWQPVDAAGAAGHPRLLIAALLVPSRDDLERARAAGARMIGWHEARKGWALRAGSTGGTHFFPVAQETTASSTASCATFSGVVLCSVSGPRARWSRVAVLRVPPASWHVLPPHLIPPSSNVLPGVGASATRTGCEVHQSKGTVACDNDWKLLQTSGTSSHVEI